MTQVRITFEVDRPCDDHGSPVPHPIRTPTYADPKPPVCLPYTVTVVRTEDSRLLRSMYDGGVAGWLAAQLNAVGAE